jgi:hypothetical protein
MGPRCRPSPASQLPTASAVRRGEAVSSCDQSTPRTALGQGAIVAFPVILYLNILKNVGATLSASSTDTGYAIADIADYRAYKFWQSGTLVTGITIDLDLGASGAANADTIGLVNQNITSQGGTVEVKADTVTPPVTVVQAAYTPTYGDVDLQQFAAPGAKRYWRVTLAKGGNFATKPFIGELFLGMRTTLSEYLAPDTDPYLKTTEAVAQRSEGGHYLGAILRGRRHMFDLAFSDAGASRTFHQSDLDAFVDNHVDLLRPFIFQIDSADSVFSRPVFVKRRDSAAVERKAVGGVWSRLTFRIPVEEAWSEAP